MWFNLGVTRAYADHDDAVRDFLHHPCTGGGGWNASDHECIPEFPELYAAAKGAGLASLQFSTYSDMCSIHIRVQGTHGLHSKSTDSKTSFSSPKGSFAGLLGLRV